MPAGDSSLVQANDVQLEEKRERGELGKKREARSIAYLDLVIGLKDDDLQ